MASPANPEDPLRRALVEVARAGGTITYRDLAARIGLAGPHRIRRLTVALEDLVREDHAAGRPLLAAVAVGRARGGIPGPGFFQLLAGLGRDPGPDRGPQAAAAHTAELEAVWARWRGRED